ncbi:MAG: DUF92 domain-containing protein [Candidatus Promineifilaceae bacterium]|nr:DUF92 domain-containing protein [Candidatus Promineifilaceae bacterium]
MQQLGLAFLTSATVSFLGYWRGSLSRSGVAGALIVGTLTFGLGGWAWGLLLGTFFVSSSLLSHFRESEKRRLAEKFDKGHRRDFGQAMANGGVGATIALLNALKPSSVWFPFFVGVMSTVNADTWATELGTLSRRRPRLITTGQVVDTGTSGGVSRLGTFVSLVGGGLIGLAAGVSNAGRHKWGRLALIGGCAGLAGSLFDSLLGATVQQIYFCDRCQKETERRNHKCGDVTRPLRGWPWLNNDLVNLIASLVGGATAVALWTFLRKRDDG